MEIGETLYVTTRDEFRNWLIKNRKTKKEIWLIQYKKATKKPSINYVEGAGAVKPVDITFAVGRGALVSGATTVAHASVTIKSRKEIVLDGVMAFWLSIFRWGFQIFARFARLG